MTFTRTFEKSIRRKCSYLNHIPQSYKFQIDFPNDSTTVFVDFGGRGVVIVGLRDVVLVVVDGYLCIALILDRACRVIVSDEW